MPKPTHDPELNRCPFCGSEELDFCRTNRNAAWVRCTQCGAESESGRTRQQAIGNWNRRVNSPGAARFVFDDEQEDEA